MFEGDLAELCTTELLTVAAEFDLAEERAAVRKLEVALAYADRHAVLAGGEDSEPLPGRERLRVYGGEGCPGVAEFAPVELGAVLRMSSGAAASFLGEALALRHRLPRIWAAVLAGNAMPWRARMVAKACLSVSMQAAAIVDRRIVGIVDTVTPSRLANIVRAAVWEADPERAKADAEAAARQRGVFVGPSDDHGTKRFWVRAAAGDVIRFDATVDDLACALKALGDTDSLDARRAKAVGWIADPAAAHQLLEVARHLARTRPNPTAARADTDSAPFDGCPDHDPEPDDLYGPDTQEPPTNGPDPCGTAASWRTLVRPTGGVTEDGFTRRVLAGALPARLAALKQHAYSHGLAADSGRRPTRHTLYVHLTDHALTTGKGVLRVEGLGPLLLAQLSELLGHDQIVVKPVIDLHEQISVHSYEIPDRIRDRVRLRHPVAMFPYSSAEATAGMDQDHVVPYDRAGPPGQTSTDNLIPLGRLHHRAKTFGGWSNRRLPAGAVEWTSPHGFRFRVDHTGTHPCGPAH
ncbi:DUF222 domain-containing protein [Kribbella sp. NPDC050124]|uniref:HNH endonuclease signature motif containing protein n=1 Tax=Kribbella sp. NPDC050124 TaxID=3364114 RepID=UPI0037AD9D23